MPLTRAQRKKQEEEGKAKSTAEESEIISLLTDTPQRSTSATAAQRQRAEAIDDLDLGDITYDMGSPTPEQKTPQLVKTHIAESPEHSEKVVSGQLACPFCADDSAEDTVGLLSHFEFAHGIEDAVFIKLWRGTPSFRIAIWKKPEGQRMSYAQSRCENVRRRPTTPKKAKKTKKPFAQLSSPRAQWTRKHRKTNSYEEFSGSDEISPIRRKETKRKLFQNEERQSETSRRQKYAPGSAASNLFENTSEEQWFNRKGHQSSSSGQHYDASRLNESTAIVVAQATA